MLHLSCCSGVWPPQHISGSRSDLENGFSCTIQSEKLPNVSRQYFDITSTTMALMHRTSGTDASWLCYERKNKTEKSICSGKFKASPWAFFLLWGWLSMGLWNLLEVFMCCLNVVLGILLWVSLLGQRLGQVEPEVPSNLSHFGILSSFFCLQPTFFPNFTSTQVPRYPLWLLHFCLSKGSPYKHSSSWIFHLVLGGVMVSPTAAHGRLWLDGVSYTVCNTLEVANWYKSIISTLSSK